MLCRGGIDTQSPYKGKKEGHRLHAHSSNYMRHPSSAATAITGMLKLKPVAMHCRGPWAHLCTSWTVPAKQSPGTGPSL